MRNCKYCNKEVQPRSMGVHVLSCTQNPKYKEFVDKRTAKAVAKTNEQNPMVDYHRVCLNCGEKFIFTARQNALPKNLKKCCSAVCARSLSGKSSHLNYTKTYEARKCKSCGNPIDTGKVAGKKCSVCLTKAREERTKLRDEHHGDKRKFKYASSFRFDPAQYPLEFPLALVERHGYYSPTNGANNLVGVTKDHRYSMADGYRNAVHPLLMRHPANCELMLFEQNKKKDSKSSITLKELAKSILRWHDKYQDTSEECLAECKIVVQ